MSTARAAWSRADTLCLCAIVVCAVAVRILTLQVPETGGDAVEKWFFARSFFHDFAWSDVVWSHHTARFGVHVPTALAILVLGESAPVYWVTPVLASTCAAAFVWLIARDTQPADLVMHGRVAGAIAALAYVLFPPTVRAGSQLLPEVFGAAYVCAATWCLVRFRGRVRIAGAALLMFAGYSAKETGVFFVPGAMVALCVLALAHGESLRAGITRAVVFAGGMLALFALESAFFSAVSPYHHRLAVVAATHGEHPRKETVAHLWQLVTRYAQLDGIWQLVLVSFTIAALALVIAAVRARKAAPYGLFVTLAVALVPASFLFCFTFMVRALRPITLWARTLDRYFDAVAPLFLLVIVLALALVAAALRDRSERVARVLSSVTAPVVVGTAIAVVVIVAARTSFRDHAIVAVTRAQPVVRDALARGLPFTYEDDERGKLRRAVHAIYADSEHLTRKIDTRWPLVEFEHLGEGTPTADAGACVVTVKKTKSYRLVVRPTSPLPAECVSPSSTSRPD